VQQGGAGVHVLLCGPAGDLALKDAPAAATAPQKPKGMSPQGLMQMIMAKGATVEVCAIYLPNKGVNADALLDGIGAAKPPVMAARLLADDTRILSF
jgi:intracellular sulfur oxidation DsrE/DsrF family protein